MLVGLQNAAHTGQERDRVEVKGGKKPNRTKYGERELG